MRRLDALVGLIAAAVLPAFAADEPLFRHRAPIVVEQNAAFVQLPLPASVYAHSVQPGLRDLRVVDGQDERVPFALLAPRPDETRSTESLRDAVLYPLPPRPAGAGTAWPAPVDVIVDGDRITVRRRAPSGATASRGPSPGWLVDLGERPRDAAPPQSLRLQWSGPAEFSAAYTLELSDDLRAWTPGGAGQVMALAATSGPLTQPNVALPAAPPRFVRLVWRDVAAAPALTGAQAVTPVTHQVTLDAPGEQVLQAGANPSATPDRDAARALHFDLGAPVPLVQVELQLGAGTAVVPARLQARSRPDEAWTTLAGTVFYRVERDGAVSQAPPLALTATARYLRLIVDERAALPPAATTRLLVRMRLGSLVFAAQGGPPYALLAGSRDAPTGALPLTTLVPAPAEERARYGRARLGDWSEVDSAAQAAAASERRAALRPWLLWAVLGGGVAGLAFLVWRLARSGAAPRPPA
jgi:hypothetical protein